MSSIIKRLKWFYPGMGVKRWVLLCMMGVSCVIVGTAEYSSKRNFFMKISANNKAARNAPALTGLDITWNISAEFMDNAALIGDTTFSSIRAIGRMILSGESQSYSLTLLGVIRSLRPKTATKAIKYKIIAAPHNIFNTFPILYRHDNCNITLNINKAPMPARNTIGNNIMSDELLLTTRRKFLR